MCPSSSSVRPPAEPEPDPDPEPDPGNRPTTPQPSSRGASVPGNSGSARSSSSESSQWSTSSPSAARARRHQGLGLVLGRGAGLAGHPDHLGQRRHHGGALTHHLVQDPGTPVDGHDRRRYPGPRSTLGCSSSSPTHRSTETEGQRPRSAGKRDSILVRALSSSGEVLRGRGRGRRDGRRGPGGGARGPGAGGVAGLGHVVARRAEVTGDHGVVPPPGREPAADLPAGRPAVALEALDRGAVAVLGLEPAGDALAGGGLRRRVVGGGGDGDGEPVGGDESHDPDDAPGV